MKHMLLIGAVALASLIPATHAKTRSAAPDAAAFGVFAPGQTPDAVEKLCKLLEPEDAGKVERLGSFDAALESKCAVLVLLIPEGAEPFCFTRFSKPPQLEARQLQALQSKKLIGIGYGAGLLLAAAGMDIDLGAAREGVPEIEVRTNSLCPELKGRRFAICSDPDPEVEEPLMTYLGLIRPSSALEEIARPIGQESESPEFVISTVLRQGSQVMVTCGVSPARWTPEFAQFFGAVAKGVSKAEAVSKKANTAKQSEPEEKALPQEPVLGRVETLNKWVGEVVKGPKGDWLKIDCIYPSQAEKIKAGEQLNLSIQYGTKSEKPVRIWATATGCEYYASSRAVAKPCGNVDRFVSSGTEAKIEAINIQMVEFPDDDHRNVLVEMQVPYKCEWTGITEEAKQRAEQAKKRPQEGQPLANIKFTALDGRQVDLAQLKGKVVLVDFWATWCAPCKKEMPHLIEAYKACKERGFEIVGINMDSEAQLARDYCQKNQIAWPQYFDGKGWKNEVALQLGVQSIPECYLLDRQGVVQNVGPLGPMLRKKVEELCAK